MKEVDVLLATRRYRGAPDGAVEKVQYIGQKEHGKHKERGRGGGEMTKKAERSTWRNW